MENNLLILVFLAVNAVLLAFILIRLSGKRGNDELNQYITGLKEDVNRQMAANRSEITQTVNSQFRMVFDTLRATSKDQNDTLKDFGQLFRQNVREFNELQREKFS